MRATLSRSLIISLVLALLLAASPFCTTWAGSLIKWVDEHGQVHYGDTVPPDQSKQERKVLSDQGVIMQVIDRAKTPAELAEEQRRAELRAEEERKRAEQAAKDHVLLATFSSDDDMIMTRDGKIAAIDTIIRLTEDRIRRITEQLRATAQQAAAFERSGRPVPEELNQRIVNGKEEIQRHKQYIETQREEQEAIRQQFALDIERFRQLRRNAAGATELPQ